MDCRKLVKQALTRWREINKTRADRNVGSLRRQFSRFAKEARPDLEFLCARGANPFVLIWIIDTHLWWWGGYAMEAARIDENARRIFSSPAYWKGRLRNLRQVRRSLSELITYAWVHIAAATAPEEGKTPFMQLAQELVAANSVMARLANTIETLGLDKPGWELVRESSRSLPTLRKTKKTGEQLGGRPKAADWGMCAAGLDAYLRESTGKPHWVSIVRLLRSAGAEGFGYEVPAEGRGAQPHATDVGYGPRVAYIDMVRRRIRRLRKNPAIRRELDDEAEIQHMVFGREGMMLPLYWRSM